MFVIFLTDRRETVEFKDYPGGDSIKFMMNFKKIFPSTMDLLLPILPESDEQVEDITWESTHKDYQMFQRLIQEWATVEFRLTALTKLKDRDFANQLVKKAQQARKNFQQQQNRLNQLYDDFVFLLAMHSYLDTELVEIGANFYLPTLRNDWKNDVPKAVLMLSF
ncbi:hypothetical protein MKI79_06415 [Acinetobacter sp. A3.8]|uniref:Uncharacterized protein n=1 Tax=Acinetobacter sedimenti TaxID=2919922 RepID=A0A9X1WX30_9GAMM|nr:hypothetical protein [Acinetobacter sedimenti]MCJ8146535.1 hypothetical protein [Acinetobacter sedimenti]